MKIYRAIRTISFLDQTRKVFYEEVETAEKNIKKLRKDDVREAVYKGIYDLTGKIREGDLFTIEG